MGDIVPEFIRFDETQDVKLCSTCQAATETANPFPREAGTISVYQDAEGHWGFTHTPFNDAR